MPSKYRSRATFYFRRKAHWLCKAGGAPRNIAKPDIGEYGRRCFRPDVMKDLRHQENLDLLEAMRHPKEVDFYQDHTYHDAWEQREMEKANARQVLNAYPYFNPKYKYKPWIWFPGDIVEVINGEQIGQRGTIIAVVPYKNEIIVQNINVKEVTVPASDSRPEQVIHREHPIDAKRVQHVDPQTNAVCDIRLIKVKKKSETKDSKNKGSTPSSSLHSSDRDQSDYVEIKRISLQSGTVFPIPSKDDPESIGGDPLKDTPFHEAMESSYNAVEEMDILVDRKLKAMEEGFIERLKASYDYHHKLQEENTLQMRRFQKDAHVFAVDRLVRELNEDAESLDDWWFAELSPYIDSLGGRSVLDAEEQEQELVGTEQEIGDELGKDSLVSA